eukprot:TCALIF_09906-PA protein Name:"Protein of unknown function" AED:0.85 eAED:1.00 QI:0/0/0/0.5/0/0.5/2/0/93
MSKDINKGIIYPALPRTSGRKSTADIGGSSGQGKSVSLKMTAATATAVLPAMDAAHLAMTEAAKLRPSPSVPGSMEAAVKMWLQVGNLQKLQQ